ncbi:MAG: hypothetical protein Q4B57_00750 [Eubacteriales bacterium]|nr:hypothetical protein [Eubacteriales bacterium]
MKKRKRILAWISIVLLVGLYLLTLIFALLDTPLAYNLFKLSLGATVVIPVLLYVYQLVYRTLGKGRDPKETKKENL